MRGKIVLGVSGGIAAYKAVELLRALQRLSCTVRVIMTRHATGFVNPRTFAVLSHWPVEVDQWEGSSTPTIDHIALSQWSDLLIVAPATANLVAKMAHGVADDALSTYCVAHRRAVVVAPAMNSVMWRHPATQENLARLQQRGVAVVPPGVGELACGEEGQGRLAEVEVILEQALAALPKRGPLAGLSILVSAGPTRERIDAVRFISNRSSGRMGVAIAEAARDLGAAVTLLHGPLQVPPPVGVCCCAVSSAAEMRRELQRLGPQADAALLAAAVADFAPQQEIEGKLDRREGALLLSLEPVPDLAAELAGQPSPPYLVVFAAEQGRQEERAREKMKSKGADAVVLNDITAPGIGMESRENEVWIASAGGLEVAVPKASKRAVAEQILLSLSGEILAHRACR